MTLEQQFSKIDDFVTQKMSKRYKDNHKNVVMRIIAQPIKSGFSKLVYRLMQANCKTLGTTMTYQLFFCEEYGYTLYLLIVDTNNNQHEADIPVTGFTKREFVRTLRYEFDTILNKIL